VIGNDSNGEDAKLNMLYLDLYCSQSFYPLLIPTKWIIGGAKVYDVTKYLNDHPGGPEIMMEFAGKETSCEKSSP
jgi:hypothetical protein